MTSHLMLILVLAGNSLKWHVSICRMKGHPTLIFVFGWMWPGMGFLFIKSGIAPYIGYHLTLH